MANVKVKLKGGQINVSGGRLGYIRRREYWKKHPVLLPLVLVVTIGAGVVVGLLVGIAVLIVGF